MTSKILETCEYMYFHLHIFLFLIWVTLLFVSPLLFIFGFKHTNIKSHLFCTHIPCICGYISLFQLDQWSLDMLQERTETEKERKNKKKQKMGSKQQTNLQRIFTRKRFQFRQVKMMCQNLLFPYLHLQKNYTIASLFKSHLRFPKDAWSRRKNNGRKWINKSMVPPSSATSRSRTGSGVRGIQGGGWGQGLGRGSLGPGSICMFNCHLPRRNSTVGFAEDWLASLLLYICHAVFTLSKIGSSCHWSLSLVIKEKKIMPNHFEDISASRLRGKKSFAIFNGSFIALNFFVPFSFS